MKLLVAPDSSMYKTPNGEYWCPTIYEYSFFERYLRVFDEIVVASRVKEVLPSEVTGYLRCDGPNMTIAELPDMHGMKDYIKKLFPFIKSAKDSVIGVDCAIIRLPSIPAFMVLRYFKMTHKKYAIEVVADPEDAYASNKLSKILFTRMLKKECASANGVSYVTKYFLQNKYPSYIKINGNDGNHFESYYSTIRLKEDYFGVPKTYSDKTHFTIIHTANNLNNNVKGHEVLIRAVAKVIANGYDVYVRFIGDGALRRSFEELSKELGIDNRIVFVGRLAGASAVRNELINSDFMVFPTKAEGLPRSIIEAMAVGLPCISTSVAGIPELLEKEDMIEPLNIDGFAKRIIDFISDPALMAEKSKRNIEIARNYSEIKLSIRRNDFYTSLKNSVDINVVKKI